MVDRGDIPGVCESLMIKRLLRGGRARFNTPSRPRHPITREILLKIVDHGEDSIRLNLNAAFTLAFAGFLRLGEITYDARQRANSLAFIRDHITRKVVQFSPTADHLVVTLRRSKTDTEQRGVRITIAAISGPLCPAARIAELMIKYSQPPNAPLFRYGDKAFSRRVVLSGLEKRLTASGINPAGYPGHSFRKGAA